MENLNLKIVFFGNTKFSLIGAQTIHEKLGLSQIVTLPDRPDKRGNLKPNPLKTFAIENQIPYLLTDKITDEIIEKVKSSQPDFLIVEDYGLILPDALLKLPKYASLNIHHSLLPKFRGTSPAPAAILSGNQTTGVSVIEMNERVDAGDILAQKKYEIKPTDTTESLLTILNKLGGKIIIPVIKNFENAKSKAIKQIESEATYSKRMSKSDGQIDIDNPPSKEILDRMIRAYHPWPTVWTVVRIKNPVRQTQGEKELRIKLLPYAICHPEFISGSSKIPDQVRNDNEFFCIQVEGGRPMSVKDFLNGYPALKEPLKSINL